MATNRAQRSPRCHRHQRSGWTPGTPGPGVVLAQHGGASQRTHTHRPGSVQGRPFVSRPTPGAVRSTRSRGPSVRSPSVGRFGVRRRRDAWAVKGSNLRTLGSASHLASPAGALAHVGHPSDDLAREGRQALTRPLGRFCSCHNCHSGLPDTMTADAETIRAGQDTTRDALCGRVRRRSFARRFASGAGVGIAGDGRQWSNPRRPEPVHRWHAEHPGRRTERASRYRLEFRRGDAGRAEDLGRQIDHGLVRRRRLLVRSRQASGLNALTVVPWAPNFAAFRRVSSNFERA